MYAKINNGLVEKFPYSIDDLRRENPNTSIVLPLSAEDAARFGLVVVASQDPPDIDERTQSRDIQPTPININGVWTHCWTIRDKTAEEQIANDARKSEQARNERNAKLAKCDWTQMADANADKVAWATYRQALRDLPEQADFPWEVTWPTQPTE